MYRHHLLTHDPRVLRRPRDVRSPRRHGSSQLLLAIGFLCAQAIHLDAPHLRASSLHVGSPLFRGACRSRTASAALWWPRAHARGRGALGRAGLPALAAPLCAATDGYKYNLKYTNAHTPMLTQPVPRDAATSTRLRLRTIRYAYYASPASYTTPIAEFGLPMRKKGRRRAVPQRRSSRRRRPPLTPDAKACAPPAATGSSHLREVMSTGGARDLAPFPRRCHRRPNRPLSPRQPPRRNHTYAPRARPARPRGTPSRPPHNAPRARPRRGRADRRARAAARRCKTCARDRHNCPPITPPDARASTRSVTCQRQAPTGTDSAQNPAAQAATACDRARDRACLCTSSRGQRRGCRRSRRSSREACRRRPVGGR